jgi:hypothetical protein
MVKMPIRKTIKDRGSNSYSVIAYMNIKLNPELTEKVLALTNEHGYAPDEIISIGIALATVLLKERRLGNRVVVVDPNGHTVGEFREVEPKAIHEMAKEYVQSVCPGGAEASAALLVARLERERDAEASQS